MMNKDSGASSPYINIHVTDGEGGYIDITPQSIMLMMEYLLQGAVSDFLGYVESHEKHENARIWLFEEDTNDLMSLNTCCSFLFLSKDRVRFMAQHERDRGITHFKAPHQSEGLNRFDEFLNLCRVE